MNVDRGKLEKSIEQLKSMGASDLLIKLLTSIKDGKYVPEDYLHQMLAKQKEEFEKSLLSKRELCVYINKRSDFYCSKNCVGTEDKGFCELVNNLSGGIKEIEGVEEKNLKELYEKYKHLDSVLSDKELMKSGDFKYNMLYEFWQVTKALTKP